jgi:hypothetical protein
MVKVCAVPAPNESISGAGGIGANDGAGRAGARPQQDSLAHRVPGNRVVSSRPVRAGEGRARGIAGDRPELEPALDPFGARHGAYFLETSEWRRGNKIEARKWHEKAREWTKKNDPANEELRRFQSEAAELLGITPPAKGSEGK